ncbi:MAG: hypothetical protein ACOC7R_02660 [Planctomycetota bacterium]
MVIWIMVALMVAFLLTAAISSIRRRGPARGLATDRVIGTFASEEELTERDRRAALGDLEILRQTGVGNPMLAVAHQLTGPSPTAELVMLMLTAQPVVSDGRVVAVRGVEPGEAAMMWAMLLHEARQMGLEADEPLVDQMMGELLGVTAETLPEYLAGLSDQGRIMPERFREAMGNLALVAMAFDAVAGGTPDQEARLRNLFELQATRMDIAMLVFRAQAFLDEVPREPSGEAFEEDIEAMFEAGKTYRPGSPDNPNPMGFGYRLPDQVKVAYAYVPLAEVAAEVDLTDADILKYQAEYREELAAAIRAAKAEQAETQPATTQPDAEVSDYLLKGEARRRLREIRAEERAQALAAELLTRAQAAAATERGDEAAESPLKAAVEALADEAPVRFVAADAWLGPTELRRDLFLGAAMTPQRTGLPQLAMQTADLLDEADRDNAPISAGEIFPQVMRVYGARSGFLVWQVTDARQSPVPSEIDEALRRTLTRDWRWKQAYELARRAADEAMGRVEETALETLATEREMDLQRAEGLTRLMIADALNAAYLLGEAREAFQARVAVMALLRSEGENREALEDVAPEGMVTAALQKPFVQFVPPIRALGYAREATRKTFLDAVFEMAPAEPSDTPPPTSAPAPAGAVRRVELPAAMSVVVAQRVGYTPAYEEDYQKVRGRLMRQLELIDRQEALWTWMDPAEIEARTGWTVVGGAQGE